LANSAWFEQLLKSWSEANPSGTTRTEADRKVRKVMGV